MSTELLHDHIVRIPRELKEKDILIAAGIGLYFLNSGNRPTQIPQNTDTVNARIKISDTAEKYLKSLLNSGEFNSKNEIFKTALSYIAEKPAWIRTTII